MIQAVAISDLHLGCAAFPYTDYAGLEVVLWSLPPAETLVIVGDLFHGGPAFRLSWQDHRILRMISLASASDRVLVLGNHDEPEGEVADLAGRYGIRTVSSLTLESESKRFHFVHGHQWDSYVEDHPLKARLLNVGLQALCWVAPSLGAFVKRVDRRFAGCVKAVREGALALAPSSGFETVVCGHTHEVDEMPGAPGGNPFYLNGGAFTHDAPKGWIELDRGAISFRRFDGSTGRRSIIARISASSAPEGGT